MLTYAIHRCPSSTAAGLQHRARSQARRGQAFCVVHAGRSQTTIVVRLLSSTDAKASGFPSGDTSGVGLRSVSCDGVPPSMGTIHNRRRPALVDAVKITERSSRGGYPANPRCPRFASGASVRVSSTQRVQGSLARGRYTRRSTVSGDGWGVGVCQDRVGRRILRGELRQARAGAGARGKDQAIRCPRRDWSRWPSSAGWPARRHVHSSRRCSPIQMFDLILAAGDRDASTVAVRLGPR